MPATETTTYFADQEGNAYCVRCTELRADWLPAPLTRVEGRQPLYVCMRCRSSFGPEALRPTGL